jgi:hypothetical protein
MYLREQAPTVPDLFSFPGLRACSPKVKTIFKNINANYLALINKVCENFSHTEDLEKLMIFDVEF